MFGSTFIVPYFVVDGIPIPVPAELLSQPDPQGGPYGFSTPSIHDITHRNWMPCSWDVAGSASSGVRLVGYTNSPGPVTVSNPSNFTDPLERTAVATWDGDGPKPTRIMPDWSLPENTRIMPDWYGAGADGTHPITIKKYVEDAFPIFSPGGGGVSQTGWYWEFTFTIFGRLSPYRWRWEDQYLIEQEVIVAVTQRGIPSPGEDPPPDWIPTEGASQSVLSEGGRSQIGVGGNEVCGAVTISDQTGKDPTGSWGSMNLYGVAAFPVNITLLVRSNFLPRPDY